MPMFMSHHESVLAHLQELLHHKYRIECPVKCVQGSLYVRISVCIYNVIADYERLGKAVVEMLTSSHSSLYM